MKIENYKSISEKEKYFNCENIETESQFLELLNQLNENENFIYRGLNEAKYKLYNSAQRKVYFEGKFSYIKTQNDYEKFIGGMILNAKSLFNGLLIKHFDSHNNIATDDYILSFLQHYGAPTPLLDWTKNPNVALFFSFQNYSSIITDTIENYVSLYCLEVTNEIPKYLDVLNMDTNIKAIKEDFKDILGEDIDQESRTFNYLKKIELALIPEYKKSGYTYASKKNDTGKIHSYYFNQNNLNIIAQEGLFFINPLLNYPLEHFFTGKLITETFEYNLPKIKCYNIKKSLIELAKNIFIQKNINEITLFPKEDIIAKMSWENLLPD